MMNYDFFKGEVEEQFLMFMSEEFHGYIVKVYPVEKVNRTLDAIVLVSNSDSKHSASPTLYINDMYDDYLKCEDLKAVLQEAACIMEKAYKKANQVSTSIDFANAKENIVMCLINTEQNQVMLENLPHRKFHDLSIIYRWVVSTDKQSISSTIINNSVAETLRMNEEELYKVAVVNTQRLFPITIKNMNDTIRNILIDEGIPVETIDLMISETAEENAMYVISNDSAINGAVSMLYEDHLHQLAEKLETNLYIMPSSIHEVIAVSSDMGDPNDLSKMVSEINMDQVSLDDRLSNNVYYYDRVSHKLSLATDTPNRRLEAIAI